MLKTSKQLGIPSLQILDFFDNQFISKEADYIACSNDKIKKIRRKWKNNLVVDQLGNHQLTPLNLLKICDQKKYPKRMNIDPKKSFILDLAFRLMEFQNDASIGKYIDSEKVYLSLLSNKLQKQRKLMTLMCCLGYTS